MGKKKSKRVKPCEKQESDSDVDNVNMNDEEFFYDEIDKFHANKEKILLQDNSEHDDDFESEEEEVLGIASDSDENEEDDASEDSDDSEEEGDDQDMVSSKAWGRKKSSFYGTDTLEGLEGSDREEAEREEEEEVIAIQKRLAEQIDEDDCGLDLLQAANESTDVAAKDDIKSRVVADFSSLSKRAQWKLAKKESPELEGLIEDFKTKITELETEIIPLMQLVKSGKIPKGYGSDFVNLKHRVYLAYLVNILFYMTLKTNKTPVQNHPVISRLVQYRTVINRLAPIDKKLHAEIAGMLQGPSNSDGINNETRLSRTDDAIFNGSDVDSDDFSKKQNPKVRTTRKPKKRQADEITEESNIQEFSKSMSEKLLEEEKKVMEQPKEKESEEENEERRAINYEMAKNKGMKQKRRKIDRNPRVKMREKYRRAKIRRKGQVREYKPELKKYSGEASGIRIGVRKSINLQ